LTVDPLTSDQHFRVHGSVPPRTRLTVTYTVRVNPDGRRGDNLLENFLIPTGSTPPSSCDDIHATLCTRNPVAELVVWKSVSPTSGTVVHAGQPLTYTLKFENRGAAGTSAAVDYTDALAGVLDDATLQSGPAASSTDLTVDPLTSDQHFRVHGSVPAGKSYTVTYTVQVKPDGQRGDNVLENFLFSTGGTPPTTCQPGDKLCTRNPVPQLEQWKSVEPASGSPVVPGDVLSYTLHFANTGAGPANVNAMDDISQAVDDASVVSQPVSSNSALSATQFDAHNRAYITGTLDPGQTATVTYELKVHPANKLGDKVIANFLMRPGSPPPGGPGCTPVNTDRPDCTHNPVGALQVGKSVEPGNFRTVHPSDVLGYTLTFHNVGKGDIAVNYLDDMTDVLDDGDVVSEPTASNGALHVSAIKDGMFHVTGTLTGGQTVIVRYSVKVKPYKDERNHRLDNFLVPTGSTHGSRCTHGNPLCTHNPVTDHATSGQHHGPTAFTGVNSQVAMIIASLLLGVGGLLILGGRRRRAVRHSGGEADS
jgi:hypothetical protein